MNNRGLLWFSFILVILIVIVIVMIAIYGYHSGSCKKRQDTSSVCTKDFCLYKEFQVDLNENMKADIQYLLENKSLQKRVTITTYPETFLSCAFPNKSGATIATSNISKYSANLIDFYQTKLRNIISKLTGIQVYPTSLDYPTSCCILIYEKEKDWINWHYDYNYYNGRFFTVLIPLTTDLTCTKFEMIQDDEIKSVDLINHAICFEGNYLYHRASKLCKNQKRVILSCQYVSDNSMSLINQMRIKIKDMAYIGFS